VRILGITGTNGAGKGTIVAYLLERHGFAHQSVRGYLYEHLDREGLPRDRDHLVAVANRLRAERGPAALAEILYERAAASGRDTIIESIRTPGEIDALEALGRSGEGFLLLAVDAPARLRWERIRARGSETDAVDFDTFRANEAREMDTDDPNKQNLRACMARAHALLDNGGTFAELYAQVDRTLAGWNAGTARSREAPSP
jgi:dephospho-CoA kinase